MIDAKTARTLVNESDALMEKYLEDLGKVIEREARLGRNYVYPELTIGLQFRTIYTVKHESFRSSELTGLQKLIKTKLQLLGFNMCLEKKEVEIGGGLGSMDDEVTIEWHDTIKISW
jgi:hypothetical protein